MYRRVLNTMAVVSFFGMLAAPVVRAQSDMLVANIPFQFSVGNTVLPSGEYHVKALNPATLMIQSRDGHSAALATTIGVSSSKRVDQGKLVFNRYGTQYFLSKVWNPGNTVGKELLKSRTEIEVAKNLPKPEVTNVAIKTP
jgi:hypothetical protein